MSVARPPTPGERRAPLPPGPRGHWLLGNLAEIGDPLRAMCDLCERFGDVVGIRLGPPVLGTRAMLIRDPELIHQVLVERRANYPKGVSRANLRPIVGEGLLTSDGAKWAEQRKRVQRLFTRDAIDRRIPVFDQCIERRMPRFAALARDGEPVDVAHEMLHLTAEMAAMALFGFDMSSDSVSVSDALAAVESDVLQRVWNPLTPPRWMPTAANRAFERRMTELRAVVDRIIHHVRTTPEGGRGMLAPMVRAAGDAPDSDELRNQLMTLLFAGHETTASALGWTWALLSEHPDAAARVENEATRVLATGPPSGAALMELRYTEQCLMESMRIYPPGWMLDRVALADDVLGGFRVPAGTLLLLSPYVTQRSAAYWPDPLRFDPDRFGGAGVAGLPRFTYFPFGGGPRRCIGMEFAITQAKLIIARISRRYRLRLVPGHVVGAEPSVTLRAKHGVRMTIEARDGA